MKKLALFGDGGSRGNPGNAASGWVVYEYAGDWGGGVGVLKQTQVIASGKYIGVDTNNQAEWQALIFGLSEILEVYNPRDVELIVCLDSLLVVSQANGKWKIKHEPLRQHYNKYKELQKQFTNIRLFHVLREFNKEADAEVNKVLDEL